MSKRVSRRALATLVAGSAAITADEGVSAARAIGDGPRLGDISAIDRMELLELIARYAWAYDCGDADAFADTFTAEGELFAFGQPVARGRVELLAFARARFAERGDRDWQHLTDHHVFFGRGARCRHYCYYSMLEGTRTDPRQFRVRSFGYYDSECERTKDGWRFINRKIGRWDAARLPWSV